MKRKFYFMLLFLGAFVFASGSALAQKGNGKGKGNGNVEAYSATSQALKGQTDTEVTVFLSTDDASEFPIPDVLKKLQIKIRDAEGEVAYLKNFKDVPITNDQLVVLVPEPGVHTSLEIFSHIKTKKTVDTEILRSDSRVMLRPDLTITGVNAPEEHFTEVPFNVEVVVNELNLETGATFDVALFEGGTLLHTYSGSSVLPGGQVSVVFGQMVVNDEGTKNYRVELQNINPGDFDVTNNHSVDFSIHFVDPTPTVNQSYFYIDYYYSNYEYFYKYTQQSTNMMLWEYDYEYRYSGLSYETYLYDAAYGTISVDPVSSDYKFTSSDNQEVSGSFIDVYPYYNDGYYSYYSAYDPVNNMHFNAYIYYYGYRYSRVYRYQSTYVEYYDTYYGTYYNYGWSDAYAGYLGPISSLDASMVTTYDGFSWGGGGSTGVWTWYDYQNHQDYVYWDWYWGNIRYQYDYVSQYYYGYNWGLTDPSKTPKSGQLSIQDEMIASQPFGLEKIYTMGNSTTIEFGLSQDANYDLVVMDMNGRVVLDQRNQKQDAGPHRVEFDNSALSTGVYVFNLRSGDQVDTKKYVISK